MSYQRRDRDHNRQRSFRESRLYVESNEVAGIVDIVVKGLAGIAAAIYAANHLSDTPVILANRRKANEDRRKANHDRALGLVRAYRQGEIDLDVEQVDLIRKTLGQKTVDKLNLDEDLDEWELPDGYLMERGTPVPVHAKVLRQIVKAFRLVAKMLFKINKGSAGARRKLENALADLEGLADDYEWMYKS